MSPCSFAAALASALCVGSGFAADSAIKRVTLYPGVAAVERVTSVTQGMNEVKFSCLPLTFDSNSLRVEADDGIRFGDVSVKTVEAALAPDCGVGSQTQKIRELEDKRAQVAAERSGHEIALNYVKSLGAAEGAARTAVVPASIEATTESMRRAVMASLVKQQQLSRQLEDVDGQLAVLKAQNQTAAKKAAQYREVLVRVAASKSGALRLNYQVSGPGWIPSYRATLDSTGNTVRMERLAVVSQSSGEDWAGVQLKLSTAQPRQNVTPPSPLAWQINVLPPVVVAQAMASPAPASPALMAPMSRGGMAKAEPVFDASVFEGIYSTEFSIAQPVDLASNDQRTSLSLGTQSMAARVFSRIVPSQAASAFVMAEVKRPGGVWIRGDLQLFRDNALVGNSTWNVGSEADITLAFGRDESLRVSVNPEQKNTSTAGFTGGKQVQTYVRAFTIENLRKAAASIEVIEASPVAINAEVEVQSKFAPEPTQKDWKAVRGVNAWTQSLNAGQSATFKADYTVTYPKEMRVIGLR